MTEKYEYVTVKCQFEEFDEKSNSLGKQGWKLFALSLHEWTAAYNMKTGVTVYAVFERLTG